MFVKDINRLHSSPLVDKVDRILEAVAEEQISCVSEYFTQIKLTDTPNNKIKNSFTLFNVSYFNAADIFPILNSFPEAETKRVSRYDMSYTGFRKPQK